jgi:hypothetical protein
MKDFSSKYRGVTYFGLNCEEAADAYGMRDAFDVLLDALKRTMEEDVRGSEVNDALDFLSAFAKREQPCKLFRDALAITDPMQRVHAARHALVRIRLACGG